MTEKLISKQQDQILLILARYRFLTRTHIQYFLHHKTPRRINIWLKDLTQKDYIGRIYSTAIGENIKPAIYYLKLKGIQVVRDHDLYLPEQLRKLYREGERSDEFVAKSLLIADIAIHCIEQGSVDANSVKHVSYIPMTNSVILSSEFEFLSPLSPELFIQKKAQRKADQYYLLWVLQPTMSRMQIRHLLKALISFYYQGEWEECMDEPFPTILIASPTKTMLIATKRMARRILEDNQEPEEIKIHVGMIEDMKEYGLTGKIWERVKTDQDYE